MRVHWGWVIVGFAAGAVLWPRVSAAAKTGQRR